MIDFTKKLGAKAPKRPVHPVEIYDTLDRASDKGELRQAQVGVLNSWFDGHRNQKDVLLKMHTGQGKTLVGLLLLQSKLNEGSGPCLYLCPNNYLVDQTILQAAQFGLKCVAAEPEIPDDFLRSKAVLVTSVQKLFNGLSKFGLDARSQSVGSIVIDDAHACIETIRNAFTVELDSSSQPYKDLFQLFKHELELQGVGTYADIVNGSYDAILPVPYWDWFERLSETAAIMSRHSNSNALKFCWPLVKDRLNEYSCLFSGTAAELHPELPSLERFGSFHNASHRVFMSATTADDSFLVKGLGLNTEVVTSPVHYEKERWSGERMVLTPSLISETLGRPWAIARFGKKQLKTDIGTVALVPSFKRANEWQSMGSVVGTSETMIQIVDRLKDAKPGNRSVTVVFANRYEGIDLPDSACRILILDGRPFGEGLIDRFTERCLGDGRMMARKVARSIEQGLGRAVRGEKDYCVVILTGEDLTQHMRRSESNSYYSPQTLRQIEIGLEIADMAREEAGDKTPAAIFEGVLNQCLGRDEGWKQFYAEEMKTVSAIKKPDPTYLQNLVAERGAWESYRRGRPTEAFDRLQSIIDEGDLDNAERGFQLQQAARILWRSDRPKAEGLQRAAYGANPYMLKPRDGAETPKTKPLSIGRSRAIKSWLSGYEGYLDIRSAIEDVLANLSFGVMAEPFEDALKKLGQALGYASTRPEREAKAGPDNLWCLADGQYILFECKSEVQALRQEIHKSEAGQMEVSCAWFANHYPGCKVLRAMVIPAQRLANDAALSHDVHLMRDQQLKTMKGDVNAFFSALKGKDVKDLPEDWIAEQLKAHHLDSSTLINRWFTPLNKL